MVPMQAITSDTMWPVTIFGKRANVHERWGADLHAVRPSAAVADDKEAQLSLGSLGRDIDLAFGHVHPLAHQHELVGERLHVLS